MTPLCHRGSHATPGAPGPLRKAPGRDFLFGLTGARRTAAAPPNATRPCKLHRFELNNEADRDYPSLWGLRKFKKPI